MKRLCIIKVYIRCCVCFINLIINRGLTTVPQQTVVLTTVSFCTSVLLVEQYLHTVGNQIFNNIAFKEEFFLCTRLERR